MAHWYRGALCGALLCALVACDKDNNRNQSIYGGQQLPPGPGGATIEGGPQGPATGGPMIPAPIPVPQGGPAVGPQDPNAFPGPGPGPLTQPLLPPGGNQPGVPDYGLTDPRFPQGPQPSANGPVIGPNVPQGPMAPPQIHIPAPQGGVDWNSIQNPSVSQIQPYFEQLRCPHQHVVIYDRRGAYDEADWCVKRRIDFRVYHRTLTYFRGVQFQYGSRMVYGYPGQKSVVITRQIIERYPSFSPVVFDRHYRQCIARGVPVHRAVSVAITEMYGR